MLLKYRYFLIVMGVSLTGYAIYVLAREPFLGCILLLPSVYTLLLGFSYQVVLFTSRSVSWLENLFSWEE